MLSATSRVVRLCLQVAALAVIVGMAPQAAFAVGGGAGCKPSEGQFCVLNGDVFLNKKCEFGAGGGECDDCCEEPEHVCGTEIGNVDGWRIDGLFTCGFED